ncbi:MAG: BMP family ABC transporter substrate-binding protein [Eubacterium sp.]|nr:BMP family ABC transporter substrate-binding protein [Eubacterium sp.]
MKQKIVAAALAGVMALSLAACGGSAKSGSGESASAASTTAGGSDVKVGIVTDVGGVNDGSFNQSAWEGLQKAGDEFGIEVKYLESKTDADYTPNIETFLDDDYDMIICIGYALADALKEEATANPDQKFGIVDDSTLADFDNVTCLMFEAGQSSYLAGYVAGKTTKTNKVGFVLGMSNAMMDEFGYGYNAGVKAANPDCEVINQNANSFTDTAQGKSIANQMVSEGADVIFHAAGGTGLGVIDACKEAGIWAIGVDSDQSSVAPETVLTSAMKRVDNAVYALAKETVEGKVEAGVQTFDLSDGGVDLAPTTDNIDPDVLKEVEGIKQDIIDGKVTVPKTAEDYKTAVGEDLSFSK